jgi:GR25 family glycosyltransferase involved in LPS biosynthesis
LRIGEIACALSHFKLWKQCVSVNQPIVIYEDDVIFGEDYLKRCDVCWKKLSFSIDPDFLMCFLGYIVDPRAHKQLGRESELIDLQTDNTKDQDTLVSYKEILETIQTKEHLFGWHGGGLFSYIISPKGAQFLIQSMETQGMNWSLDFWILLLLRDPTLSNHIWMLKKPVVSAPVFDQSYEFDTDIQKSPFVIF